MRWPCIALVAALGFLGITPSPRAQTTCVPLEVCASDSSYAEIREPYSSKTWFIGPIPGSPYSDRIYLQDSDVIDMVRKAFRVYSDLDHAVPYDYTSTSTGDVTFAWGWRSRQEIQGERNRRAGIAGAATALGESNCFFNYSIAKFAYDPQDGLQRQLCWTGDWCDPPWCTTTACGDTTNLDFLSAAVHEYGHALGLDHSNTSGATMAATMYTQDSTGRALLACEANKVVATYHDNNPAATVTGYTVARSAGGVTVSWLAEQEASTDHYVIERASDWSGPFAPLTDVPVNGSGTYAVALAAATPGIFRLTEVESDDMCGLCGASLIAIQARRRSLSSRP